MIFPELQMRAELAHALASNQADAALEVPSERIDPRLALGTTALQPMAATRELYRSSPVPMRMSALPAPRAQVPRGFFAG